MDHPFDFRGLVHGGLADNDGLSLKGILNS